MGGIHLYAGVVTALYDRDRSGVGGLSKSRCRRRCGRAFAGSFDYYYRTGQVPPRTGNRQAGLNSAPYNVFPTKDGHVAIHVVTEAHFQNLLKAMGREDLADDPRFATNAGRVAHMDETDALVAGLDPHAGQDGGVRDHQGIPHSVRAGAHRARGHE